MVAAPAPAASPTQRAELLRDCALAAAAAPGACAWCATPLAGRRRVWCGDRCATKFWTNHWWSLARAAAKRRDKYACVRCGRALPKRPTRARFPREAAFRAATRAWRAARKRERLEVNHIAPARGAHRKLSCLHHLDNLETLCVDCHKAFTYPSKAAPE